jgi:hypothetical protein
MSSRDCERILCKVFEVRQTSHVFLSFLTLNFDCAVDRPGKLTLACKKILLPIWPYVEGSQNELPLDRGGPGSIVMTLSNQRRRFRDDPNLTKRNGSAPFKNYIIGNLRSNREYKLFAKQATVQMVDHTRTFPHHCLATDKATFFPSNDCALLNRGSWSLIIIQVRASPT